MPFDLAPAGNERQRGIPAEKGEAAPPFGVLDGFEEKAFAFADELDENRQGRFEIGEHLVPHRDDGVAARQLDELLERGLHTGPGVAPLPNARKKQLRSPVWHAPRPSCSTTNRSTSMSQS